MTDPNIKPEPSDIDHDPDGLSLRHDADGRLTARDGARVWTSVDQGRTWAPVNADCDGLPADWSWLPKVVGEMAAEGWPEGWYPCSGGETRQCCNNSTGWPWIVPNTEPGRRAAWAMEGE